MPKLQKQLELLAQNEFLLWLNSNKKISKTIESCNFENLKKMEKNDGFDEAAFSEKLNFSRTSMGVFQCEIPMLKNMGFVSLKYL